MLPYGPAKAQVKSSTRIPVSGTAMCYSFLVSSRPALRLKANPSGSEWHNDLRARHGLTQLALVRAISGERRPLAPTLVRSGGELFYGNLGVTPRPPSAA